YTIKDNAYALDPACEDNRGHPRLDNGAVYVFSRNNKIWTQEAYLKPAVAYLKTTFGYSVALSGDGSTLAVGATGDASTGTGVNANPAQIEYSIDPEKYYIGSG